MASRTARLENGGVIHLITQNHTQNVPAPVGKVTTLCGFGQRQAKPVDPRDGRMCEWCLDIWQEMAAALATALRPAPKHQ